MAVCSNCGAEYSEERKDAGYDYCMKPKCVETLGPKQSVVVEQVNKSHAVVVTSIPDGQKHGDGDG